MKTNAEEERRIRRASHVETPGGPAAFAPEVLARKGIKSGAHVSEDDYFDLCDSETHPELRWIDLGYGSRELAVARIPPDSGTWVLICDEDAARAGMSSCWYAAQTDDLDEAEQGYRRAGGTVSSSELIIR